MSMHGPESSRKREGMIYKKMKGVSRHDSDAYPSGQDRPGYHGWRVECKYDGVSERGFFSDLAWGGPRWSLRAANALAVELHIDMGKPITRRWVHARSHSNTGIQGVHRRPGGALALQWSPHPGEWASLYFPADTSLDEIESIAREMREKSYADYPIDYDR